MIPKPMKGPMHVAVKRPLTANVNEPIFIKLIARLQESKQRKERISGRIDSPVDNSDGDINLNHYRKM